MFSNSVSGSTSTTSIQRFCRKCDKTDQKLKACGACRQVFYCSIECQSTDWGRHKVECRTFTSAGSSSQASTSSATQAHFTNEQREEQIIKTHLGNRGGREEILKKYHVERKDSGTEQSFVVQWTIKKQCDDLVEKLRDASLSVQPGNYSEEYLVYLQTLYSIEQHSTNLPILFKIVEGMLDFMTLLSKEDKEDLAEMEEVTANDKLNQLLHLCFDKVDIQFEILLNKLSSGETIDLSHNLALCETYLTINPESAKALAAKEKIMAHIHSEQ